MGRTAHAHQLPRGAEHSLQESKHTGVGWGGEVGVGRRAWGVWLGPGPRALGYSPAPISGSVRWGE